MAWATQRDLVSKTQVLGIEVVGYLPSTQWDQFPELGVGTQWCVCVKQRNMILVGT